MHASLARERYHRARADADVGQRAAVKTYEELGGFAPALAQPRHNSQEAQDVEDEHGRYSLDRIRDLVSFTPECFLRLYRSFPVFSGALLKSGADGAIGDGPEEGGCQSPPSSERVSCEQSACYLCFPVIEFERARGSRIGQRPLDLDDEVAGRAVELVGLLKIDGVAAVRHNRERGGGYVLLH